MDFNEKIKEALSRARINKEKSFSHVNDDRKVPDNPTQHCGNITTNDPDPKYAFSSGIVRKTENQSPIETPGSEPSVIPFSRPNGSPQRSPIKAVSKPIGEKIEAYMNRSNELLIQNPAAVDLVDKIRADQNEQEPNVFSLEDLANGNKAGYYAPKKKEILSMIEKYGNVNRREAKNRFNTLLQDGSIEAVSTDYYYIR